MGVKGRERRREGKRGRGKERRGGEEEWPLGRKG